MDTVKIGALDKLVDNKTIKSYSLKNKNLFDKKSDCDNYEVLIIEFNDGKLIEISTFCSGSMNNTTLCFE